MSSDHRFRKLSEARALTEPERQVLWALLAAAGPERGTYECQAANARVSEECEECPTVFFSVDPKRCPPVGYTKMPFEAAVTGTPGQDIRLLLFVRNGYIDELETYRTDGEAVGNWPDAGRLTLVR